MSRGDHLLTDALILSAVAKEAKKQEKALEKEKKKKERSPFTADGKSPEYAVAVAIATGNLEGVSPELVPYVMAERERLAKEEAEKAEKERAEREAAKAAKAAEKAEKAAAKAAAKAAKAEGKPRRFPWSGKGGGNE